MGHGQAQILLPLSAGAEAAALALTDRLVAGESLRFLISWNSQSSLTLWRLGPSYASRIHMERRDLTQGDGLALYAYCVFTACSRTIEAPDTRTLRCS